MKKLIMLVVVILACINVFKFHADEAFAQGRTLWVDKLTGNNGDNGLSETTAKATIQGAFDIAQNGDLILVVGNETSPVVYYETPTLSGPDNIWLLAHPRGGVIVSSVDSSAREGTLTWTSDGDNRWRITKANPPWVMGYTDTGGKDWILVEYTCNDLNDHVGNFQFFTNSIPEYGYCHDAGTLKIRLPGNANPNGKTIKIGGDRYNGDILNLVNSNNVIIDGFTLEGAGFRCISAEGTSSGTRIRNTEFEYCHVGAELGDNSIVEWSRYRYPGYIDFDTECRALSGDNPTLTTYALVKEYAIEGGSDHTISAMEGTFVIGRGFTENLDYRYNVAMDVFDPLRIGQGFINSRAHHCIMFKTIADGVEFESDNEDGGAGNRVDHCFFHSIGTESVSYQRRVNFQTTFDHNVYFIPNDDPPDIANRMIKDHVDDAAADHRLFNNLFITQYKDLFRGAGSRGEVDFTMQNNIFVADSNGISDTRNPVVSNNLLIKNSNVSWLTSNNGIHATSSAGVNWSDFNAGNYGITSGSIAEDAGVVIAGITDGFSGSAPDLGPFEVGETPGIAGVDWPRNIEKTYDLSVPQGWTGAQPPSSAVAQGIPAAGRICSAEQTPDNVCANLNDLSLATRWSCEGIGCTATYELPSNYMIKQVRVAHHRGDERNYLFRILLSLDGVVWRAAKIAGSTAVSSPGNTEAEVTYTLDNQMSANFIRYEGNGNSVGGNDWNNLNELQVDGTLIPYTVNVHCERGVSG